MNPTIRSAGTPAPTGEDQKMKDAWIVASKRTAVGRAKKGSLRNARPDDLAASIIGGLLAEVPALKPEEINDVIFGCAMPEAEQGMNVSRIAVLRAGLPVSVPAVTVNRFCSSGLETIMQATARIRAGMEEVVIAGGTESMSLVPMGGHKLSPNPSLVEVSPDSYLGMGLTAEVVAKNYEVNREDQDAFSLESHRRAAAAIDAGHFQEEIHPYEVVEKVYNKKGRLEDRESVFETDEGPRRGTSIEALAKLRPAFALKGTVTAGNSSQMSDGAAGALLMSEDRAKAMGLKPLGRLVAYAVAGVKPEEMGIGPTKAIPKVLKRAGMTLDQIDTIELNEAFAAQSLAVIRKVGLNPDRVNPLGGAIALGHPLGCTGAKLVATILRELKRRDAQFGMVTMCVGGGMGAAGIIERLN